MTELRLPPLVADHSQLWLQVDLGTNWAWRAAAQLLARPRWAQYRSQGGQQQLTAQMKRIRAALPRKPPGPVLGFFLFPSPEDGIKGMATLAPGNLDGQNADEALADLVGKLAATSPAEDKPEITRMQTAAGDCRRLRRRCVAADGETPEGWAVEEISYLWVFEDYGAVTLIMTFPTPHEAERWLPALDELACGVRQQRSPDEPGLAIPELAAAVGAGGGIEVRPVRPEGKVHPFERATLARWVLAAGLSSGTLILSGDGLFGGKRKIFQLPSTGQPGAVTTVCLATYPWEVGRPPRSGCTWRMLFLDRERRVVGASFPRHYWSALRLFPPEVFEPLRAVGIGVVSEWCDSAQALEDAHPGGVRKVDLAVLRRGF
jgi:hypothetical protein